MSNQLSSETCRVLRQYLEGRLSNDELEDSLAGAEYDLDLSQEERDSLATIRLSVIDFDEGRSEASGVVEAVAALLASVQPEKPIVVLRTDASTMRTDASTTWKGQSQFSATPSRLERVGI